MHVDMHVHTVKLYYFIVMQSTLNCFFNKTVLYKIK